MLPVIETDPYESLGIVSTNLMATTDGHLAFSAPLDAEGVYPAIADDQSITRIGRATQGLLARQLSSRLRTLLAEGRRMQQYAQFGATVGSEVAVAIRQRQIIEAMLRQAPGERIPLPVQAPLLAMTLTTLFNERDAAYVSRNKSYLIQALVEDPRFADLVKRAAGEMPLEKYLPLVEAVKGPLLSVCHD